MDLPTQKELEHFGPLAYNGIELSLLQRPHPIGTTCLYAAMAVDADEHAYLVTWLLKSCYIHSDEECPLPEDDSDVCDWADYIVNKM